MSSQNVPSAVPDEPLIRAALRQVIDPEAGINIVDLGLVYRIEVAAEVVAVEMTMTSPACPLGDMIIDDVKSALRNAIPSNWRIDARLVWSPPWEPAMMSDTARKHFAG